ncbi:hypothetical protein [Arsenicicoccus sp. oral taxon 190]|uniref:hypothetical protein n=1 Tax=Arsenicicoccus sp. oral taxon 190 TaxID=1658671 RepID=UPI00067A03F4|nr:hypothetical protein [Arsenicicoccus sp. oral taxon 190]AKT51507.1 hypothetical protein ADJ73_09650 [Arsenicicoccus sp. oral taxon 190]
MTAELRLLDAGTATDLRTFVSRAASVDRDGAVRLQAQGTVLAAYAAVLPGAGLSADGLVLGLRTMRLAVPADLDVTVPVSGLLDRFARSEGEALPVPPTELSVSWAGVAPPRVGWVPFGRVSADELRAAAQQGIAEVARGTDGRAGALAVAELRRRTWARPMEAREAEGVPSGLAFAAQVLGFVGEDPGTVYRCGRWLRLTTRGGHVLTH